MVMLMIVIQRVLLILPFTEALERHGGVLGHLDALLVLGQDRDFYHRQTDGVLDAGVAVEFGRDRRERQQVMVQVLAVLLRHGRVRDQQQLHVSRAGHGALASRPRVALRPRVPCFAIARAAAVPRGHRFEIEAFARVIVESTRRVGVLDDARVVLVALRSDERRDGVPRVIHRKKPVESAAAQIKKRKRLRV